jgi:hypothetical protein
MTHDPFHDFAAKKAFEIAYAFFRLGSHAQSTGYAESLECQGLTILTAATDGAYVRLQNSLVAGEYFLKLGLEVNAVSSQHVELISQEIRQLYETIQAHLESKPAVSLQGIFSSASYESGNQQPGNGSESLPAKQSYESPTESPVPAPKERSMDAEIRQNYIMSKIRQSGNCRLKEIQDILPGASERTIRYDIQELISKGLIERAGGGGPATFYRVRREHVSDPLVAAPEALA